MYMLGYDILKSFTQQNSELQDCKFRNGIYRFG